MKYSVAGGDESSFRCASMATLSEMTPHALPDGRVIFSLWEYIDNDLTCRQSLWIQNPDGTRYQLFFGNTVRNLGPFFRRALFRFREEAPAVSPPPLRHTTTGPTAP